MVRGSGQDRLDSRQVDPAKYVTFRINGRLEIVVGEDREVAMDVQGQSGCAVGKGGRIGGR